MAIQPIRRRHNILCLYTRLYVFIYIRGTSPMMWLMLLLLCIVLRTRHKYCIVWLYGGLKVLAENHVPRSPVMTQMRAVFVFGGVT